MLKIVKKRKKEFDWDKIARYFIITLVIGLILTFVLGQIQARFPDDYTILGQPFPVDYFVFYVFGGFLILICYLAGFRRDL